MIRIVVCDDSMSFAEELNRKVEKILEEKNMENTIRLFSNEEHLLTYVENYGDAIDLLFLDIVLVEKCGIDIGRELNQRYPNILIIFVSAHINYAQEIFEAAPQYFIVKPVTEQVLKKALEKVLDLLEKNKKQVLPITSRQGIFVYECAYIEYIEQYNKKIYLHYKDGIKEFSMKLDKIEANLPAYFLRCRHSFIVNMNRVKALKDNQFYMYSGSTIKIPKPKYAEIREKFLDFIGTEEGAFKYYTDGDLSWNC